MPVSIGATVELQGLTSASLNGARGLAEAIDTSTGRIVVRLSGNHAGTADRMVKVKVSNVKEVGPSDAWQGIEHGAFCFGSGDRLVCKVHCVEVCGTCCLDFALLNTLRFDKDTTAGQGTVGWVERAAEAYLNSPASEQYTSVIPCMDGLPGILAKVKESRRATPAELVLASSAVTYLNRQRNGARPLSAILEHSILALHERDEEARERRAYLEQASRNDAERAEKKEARKTQRGKGKSREVDMDAGANVERMLVIVTKAGVRSLGSFFEEFDTFTRDQIEGLKVLRNAPPPAHPSGTIAVTGAYRRALENYQKYVKWMLDHTTVPITDPATWKPGEVQKFLETSRVVLRPLPSSSVLLEVARELISFKSKMLYCVQNMPDEEKAQRIGARSMSLAQEGKDMDSCDDWFSSDEDEKVVMESSPIPKDLDPAALRPLEGMIVECLMASADMDKLVQRSKTDEALKLQMKLALETDDDRLRKKDVVYQFENPEETTGVFIQVLGVKILRGENGTHIPIMFLRFGFQHRSDMARPEKLQSFAAAITEVQRSGAAHVKENTWSRLALKNLARMLRRNRKQLRKESVAAAEESWAGGFFKYSALVLTSSGIVSTCPPCGKSATKKCSACKQVAYCSPACQKCDWATHKAACKAACKVKGKAQGDE